jgi:AcrR family transcriptional regulator
VAEGHANAAKKVESGRRTGRPTQLDANRKSETLIGVATDFFVEHGFSGATIEAIAQAANMGKQAVYTRFTDKESLFTAVIQRLKDKAVFLQLPSDDHDPIGDGLPRRIYAIFADAASPQATIVSKLAMREGHRFPDLVPLLVEGTRDRYSRPLSTYLDARKLAGEIRDVDTLEIAELALDLIFAEIGRSVYTDTPIADARIKSCSERIATIVLKGIAAP